LYNSISLYIRIFQAVPGRTLVIGGSYIALECAGFLHEFGWDTTVMVRSILLRGFDRQCADQVGEAMERHGMRFINPCVPTKLEKLAGDKGPITVTWKDTKTGAETSEEFTTVLFATGRAACVKGIGLETTGVKLERNFIVTDADDKTNVDNIYAIGDVVLDKPELTPVAIQAGILLAKRMFGGASKRMDYVNVCTTVFTPLEYGCVGLSEEDARAQLGKEAVEVHMVRYGALENATLEFDPLPEQRSNVYTRDNSHHKKYCDQFFLDYPSYEKGSYDDGERERGYLKQPQLAKLVCDKASGKVLGFHYVGLNAGEVTQGFGLAVKLGCTKQDFDDLVGIHPTCAEEFTTIPYTYGEDYVKTGGC
jgi:thioredoxin reductase (NADPH)